MKNSWHLINDPSPRRGGAQRILNIAIQNNEKVLSKLDGQDTIYGKALKKYSWMVYIVLAFFREKPKLIFIHSRCFLPYTWLFRLFKTRVIFYGHAQYRSRPWTLRLFPCNYYIAVSQAVSSFLIDLGVPREKITVIRNPYMGGEYIGSSSKTSCTTNISYIGGLHTWKGIDKAIDLLCVYAKNSDAHINLSIVGEGPLRNELDIKIRECPNNLSVNFLGYQNAPYSKLFDTAIVLIPSLEEGFGLVAIEAIYQGKIIVHTDIPALSEVCQDDQLSFAFDIADSSTFTSALDLAINVARTSLDESFIRDRTGRIDAEYGMDRFRTEQILFRSSVTA